MYVAARRLQPSNERTDHEALCARMTPSPAPRDRTWFLSARTNVHGAPRGIRTPTLRIKSPLLYRWSYRRKMVGREGFEPPTFLMSLVYSQLASPFAYLPKNMPSSAWRRASGVHTLGITLVQAKHGPMARPG